MYEAEPHTSDLVAETEVSVYKIESVHEHLQTDSSSLPSEVPKEAQKSDGDAAKAHDQSDGDAKAHDPSFEAQEKPLINAVEQISIKVEKRIEEYGDVEDEKQVKEASEKQAPKKAEKKTAKADNKTPKKTNEKQTPKKINEKQTPKKTEEKTVKAENKTPAKQDKKQVKKDEKKAKKEESKANNAQQKAEERQAASLSDLPTSVPTVPFVPEVRLPEADLPSSNLPPSVVPAADLPSSVPPAAELTTLSIPEARSTESSVPPASDLPVPSVLETRSAASVENEGLESNLDPFGYERKDLPAKFNAVLQYNKSDSKWIEVLKTVAKKRGEIEIGENASGDRSIKLEPIEQGNVQLTSSIFCIPVRGRFAVWKVIGVLLGIFDFTDAPLVGTSHQWLCYVEDLLKGRKKLDELSRQSCERLAHYDFLATSDAPSLADYIVYSVLSDTSGLPNNVDLWVKRMQN